VNLNVNATLDVVIDEQLSVRPADRFGMLSFQKLRVYQRSIDFLALTIEIIGTLPKGHAELADQLLRAAQSQPATSPKEPAVAPQSTKPGSIRTREVPRWRRLPRSTRCA
jgi:hypothetical protein